MRGLGLIAIALLLWLLWPKKAKAQPAAGPDELSQLPPDPAQTRAPESPLIGGYDNPDATSEVLLSQSGLYDPSTDGLTHSPAELKAIQDYNDYVLANGPIEIEEPLASARPGG